MPYIKGKLRESTFKNFLRIFNTCFGEEVMTIWVTECQSARISDLDQNLYFEAQTTLTRSWMSFEGFITLITAENKKTTWRLEEDVKIREDQRSHIIRTSIVVDSHKEAAKPSSISLSSTVYLFFVIFYSPCMILQPCVADFSYLRARFEAQKCFKYCFEHWFQIIESFKLFI